MCEQADLGKAGVAGGAVGAEGTHGALEKCRRRKHGAWEMALGGAGPTGSWVLAVR